MVDCVRTLLLITVNIGTLLGDKEMSVTKNSTRFNEVIFHVNFLVSAFVRYASFASSLKM